MSELSRSLVDAAAEALRAGRFVDPDDDTVPTFFQPEDDMPEDARFDVWKPVADPARAAVAAVLEKLAARAHWLKPDNSDGFVTAVEVNEVLRRLAVEARSGEDG